ncbi:MAG: DNA polymerase III subunit beta [Methylococcaceae bacterium]|nr:MAG: DNA polymerase III subunit beta [Methylococcaceae bacterium]
MRLTVSRAILLGLLQKVIGVVESKQTLAILSNVLFRCGGGRLSLTATDLEMELIAEVDFSACLDNLTFTVPARTLLDMCQSLAEDSTVDLLLEGEKLRISSGKARFNLTTLPAENFPGFDTQPIDDCFAISGPKLRRVLEKTKFAMALQDVRFYLNGLLLEVEQDVLRAVTSDGHRLAYSEQKLDIPVSTQYQVIIPRKGVAELYRLLGGWEDNVEISLGSNNLRALIGDTLFSVKLLDSKYPDYRRVIPSDLGLTFFINKLTLKHALSRVIVVCPEKFRAVRFDCQADALTLSASGPDHEDASDVVDAHIGKDFQTAYNGSYVLDALNHCDSDMIKFCVSDSSTACVIESDDDSNCRFVVMPLRL